MDPARSSITFTTRHMFGLGKVNGTFDLGSASITITEPVTDSSAHAVVDADSFRTDAPRRDEHVRSEAFLDTARHPAITFESTRVDRGEAGVWTVEGLLTVRGHRAPVRLTVDSLTVEDGSLRLVASSINPWNIVEEGGGGDHTSPPHLSLPDPGGLPWASPTTT
ncbi:YceI family protein [Streptomyces sp. NPDC086549]|uniref:YceI family protein n=1 Tax=Streptomyces sp. NPDC086549 TaxID=3365752 RepID=UPI00382C998D